MTLRWDRGRYSGFGGGTALPVTAGGDATVSSETVGGENAAGQSLTWGELGCPREIGVYRVGRNQIRVKKIHIIVAENDPAALFTVVELRPPLGPPEFQLGHRVA